MAEIIYALRLVKITGEKEPVILWMVSKLSISRGKASDLIYFAPSILASDLAYSVADSYRQELESLGAMVEVENADLLENLPANASQPINKSCIWVLLFIAFIIFLFVAFNQPEKTQPKATPTQSEEIIGISGLTPSILKTNLEGFDFSCSDMRSAEDPLDQTWYLWYCEKKSSGIEFYVDYQTRTFKTVETLDATVIQYSNPDIGVADHFLEYMATFAFLNDSTSQDEAHTWINQTLKSRKENEVITKSINSINFSISGPQTAIILTISK